MKLQNASAAEMVGRSGVSMVGYETANRITNRGAALREEKGLVPIWILGMLNATPDTLGSLAGEVLGVELPRVRSEVSV